MEKSAYVILSTEKCAVAGFIKNYMINEALHLNEVVKDMEEEDKHFPTDEFSNNAVYLYGVLGRIYATDTGKKDLFGDPVYDSSRIILTKSEAQCLTLAIEFGIFDLIRADRDIDNINWVITICGVYKRLSLAVKRESEKEKAEADAEAAKEETSDESPASVLPDDDKEILNS